MKINTIRFGEIEVDKNNIIKFDRGPLGFEGKLEWFVIDNGLLSWLQCAQDPELAFVVTNPFEFYSDYEFSLTEGDTKSLKVTSNNDVTVFSIVSVPPNVENMTINLLAPIVVNYNDRTAKQIILNTDKYSVRHYVYNDLVKSVEKQESVGQAC